MTPQIHPYRPGPAGVTPPDEPIGDRQQYRDDGPLASGELDLAERNSLRRVVGLSTELDDVTEVEYRQLRLEKVVLVSVWISGTQAAADNAMLEFKALAETAGSWVLAGLVQRRQSPDPATYVGSGKVAEVRECVLAHGADTVICDGELTPAQLRTLEDRIGVKVVDRTALILDIFAQHAKSVEGKAQVELAQLNYLRQRLRGWGTSLSRQVGGRASGGLGIGGRGPGETKIETDRRRINHRIAVLQGKLRDMAATRAVKRADRQRHSISSVAIVGYTNAGKSSLLNRLTEADTLVENALFATLDPITRRATTTDGRIYTLTDTVGFVRHLPTDLVEAFRSTLEETLDADLLVHVVDAADPDPLGQVAAVRQVLSEIGAASRAELMVMNKCDLADPDVLTVLGCHFTDALFTSAQTGQGLAELRLAIEQRLPTPKVEMQVIVPWNRGDLVDRVHREAELHELSHEPAGTRLHAWVHSDLAAQLAPFTIEPNR